MLLDSTRKLGVAAIKVEGGMNGLSSAGLFPDVCSLSFSYITQRSLNGDVEFVNVFS